MGKVAERQFFAGAAMELALGQLERSPMTGPSKPAVSGHALTLRTTNASRYELAKAAWIQHGDAEGAAPGEGEVG